MTALDSANNWLWGCRVSLLILLAGCHAEPQIVQYEVSLKLPEVLRTQAVPQQILAAMAVNEDALWFFKMSGDPAAVTLSKEPFRKWLNSVDFADDKPKWELPDGWKSRPGSEMRFATLIAEVDGQPIEASVTKLGFNGDWEQAVRDNVNRWRNQVGLAPSEDELAGAEILTSRAGLKLAYIDLVGEAPASGASMAKPPMAGHPPIDSAIAATGDQSTTSIVQQNSETPISWRPGKKGSMRLAAFEAGDDDKTVEITVIRAMGDAEGNVRRWLGQIRSEVVDQAVVDALSEAKDVEMGDTAAKLYRLSGDKDQVIFAIILPEASGSSLFVKMTGNSETAQAEEDNFVSFAKSLPFN